MNDENDSDDDDEDSIDLNRLNNDRIDSADLQRIIDEENSAIDELHTLLSKTRQKIIKSKLNEEALMENATIKTEQQEIGVSLDNLNTVVEMKTNGGEDEDDDERGVVLDSLSEFCKNIGGREEASAKRNGMYVDSDEEEADENEDAKTKT
jgi:hypothetical protein